MKKRKYTHIKELEPILLQMREDGSSRREIAVELGLTLILEFDKKVKNCSAEGAPDSE